MLFYVCGPNLVFVSCRRPSVDSSGFCCGWDIIKLKIQKRCIFRIKLMQRRCREEVKMTPKKGRNTHSEPFHSSHSSSLHLTPVHSSFSSVSEAQSNQSSSVPFRSLSEAQSNQSSSVPFRSLIANHQSGVTSADLVLPMEPRTVPPRTTLGGVQQQTAVAPGFARLGRHIIVTHSTSTHKFPSHSHASHSALQQTPHNTK